MAPYKCINSNKNSGFSLIELVVSIAVLSVLSTVAIPMFSCFLNKSKATAAMYLVQDIKKNCIIEDSLDKNANLLQIKDINGYRIKGISKDNCDDQVILAQAIKDDVLPSFQYNVKTDDLGYKFKGMEGKNLSGCLGLICGNGIFSNKSKEMKKKYNIHDFVVKDAAINNGCSDYVVVEASSWDEAQQKSQALGGDLVTINNKDEYSWLQKEVWGKNKLLNNAGDTSDESTYFFTGLNDAKQEGKYVWASGEESEFDNNEDLIHRQNWIAQQHNASSSDYFVIGGTNDVGFTDYTHEEYRPDLYSGTHGQLTWVDNNSSWHKNNGNPRHFGLAEIPSCR